MKNFLGLDLGFVQVKSVGFRWQDKFGSIVKRRSDTALDLDDAEGFTVVDDNGVWNVGAKGTYDFTAERLKRDTDTPKLLGAFGTYQEATGHSHIDLLVSGLPVYEFNTYRYEFEDSLRGDFAYGFGRRKLYMRVQDSLVIPQSAGAFYDYVLTEDGDVSDEPLALETVLVLDIGGRTSDGCIMESSKYSQDSFTIFQGVWKVHSELRKLIAKEYRYTLHTYEVDIVLRTKLLKMGSGFENVEHLCRKAVDTVFPALRDELSLHIEDYRRFSAILLVGGGAYVFRDWIQNEVPTIPVIIPDDAEFANASGYRKYGLLMKG